MDRFQRQELGECRSFNSVLQWKAEHQNECTAFIYLADGEREAARLTFGDLDRRARSVAAWLQERKLAGKRIVLLYRAGLDFIVGFLGCLYAGAVAVPAYPPHPRRADPRLESILDDCGPAAAFCVREDCERLSHSMVSRGLEIVATDTLSDQANLWKEPRIGLESLAHLQYTSGSTGDPKGVMVSHGNLLHQVEYVNAQVNCDENTVNVTWQPFFHDMGLVGSVLTSIFCGALTYVMPPEAFLRSPIRWLKAISRYGGTSAPAPNFAYDLCVTRTTPAQREGLDLSTWECAWNGAEPVRVDTLDRFCKIYEPYGFRTRAFIPCYGMAETTLSTTMDRPDRPPVIAGFRRDELERNQVEPCPPDHPSATRLVSSGVMSGDMEVAIVNAETLDRCPDGRTGEIWVSGPSVAQGYWQRPDETERTFNAHLSGKNERRYLRTGDLGFVRDGELFVTGRLKDLIIIRGRNVYPQDVELVAQQSHEALQIDGCAAFSVEVNAHEELALALEVKRTQRHRLDPDEVFEAVRGAIGEHFGVAVHWLGLVQPGRVPKTSSGKVMRGESRRQHLSGELSLLAEWRSHTREDREDASPSAATGLIEQLLSLPQSDRYRALVIHLQGEIAHALELRGMPDPKTGFQRLGLDSMGAVELVNRLQGQLRGKVNLPTTLLFDQPNIEAVARYVEESLFGQLEQSAAPVRGDRPLDEPVAVVGLACRFPGAADADKFWQLLDEGRDAIREVPDSRWDIEAYFDPDAGAVGKMNSRFGGFIDDIEGFDAAFFDISPREATSMDPQHRHLLEVSWLALENAGIAPASIDGRPVGVFVGISTSDYEQILAGRGPEMADAFMATGNAHSAAVGRLSFALGLQGPCVAVDTACSSSLVAVHQAVQSLRQGECEMALAGGVNAVLRPEVTVAFCKARLLSPDGKCKTFDAAADGYVRSEGCGMVVLKRLSDAKRDGDRILAVIRGSAINQDGRSSGLTAPNGPSQTQVIANALGVGKVDPASVQYLECHGTGTVLGDPIEVQAANAIFSRGRGPDDPLVIGSVKSNLGHLEAAAGVAGLIKVVLALQHARIPRSLHFRTPNPHIPWASMPVRVAAETLPWKSTNSRTRIAGVSSFGFAGTNAHVVIEEAPRPEVETDGEQTKCVRGPSLLAISARTELGLKDLAGRYAVWLRAQNGVELSDICHTANTGRNHFEHRAVVICDSRDGALQKLDALARSEAGASTISGLAPRQHRPRVAFLFPGQGLQYAGMARDLYERAPAFRECLDRCADAYDGFGREDSPPLKAVMFDSESTELLKQTRYVQPALYALQVSLAALWQSWGVKPDALLGHSAGEYAAACVAGVFRVEDGLRLIVERARLMQTLPSGGTMLSVTAPVETVEAAIAGDASVQVSAYNGLNTVISGPIERLDALIEQFHAQGLYCSKLPASNAFHSPSIEPILDDFEACARRIEFAAPTGRLISTMTGKAVAHGEIHDAAYWRNQARQPVRFAQGIRALFEDIGCDVALELGPQAELIWLAQMSWRPDHKVLWASSLAKGRNAFEQVLNTAAQLHANGTTLNFAIMETQARGHRKLPLPSYPFQHERFWPGPMGGEAASALHDCFYHIQWQASDEPTSRSAEKQSRLILANDTDLGIALEMELQARGQGSVIRGQVDGNATSPDAIRAILENARRQGPVDHVVLIAGPIVDPGADGDAVRDAQSFGVTSALLVAQALISAREATRLWLVTRGAHAVLDNEAVDPTHSPMWGFGRTFAVEHPDRYGGLIDLPLAQDCSKTAAELASALLRDDGENQVALRDGKAWLARLQRHAVRDELPLRLRADATYLVTGGTGALGLTLARHLVERGARQIVLTSRSGGNDSARAAVQALADSGCRVDIYRADVSVRLEAERLMEQVLGAPGAQPLRGIIHAAGVLEGAPIASHTPELLASVMAPKVWGAWNLHRLACARGIELDIFVLFSSAASLLGLRGHSNYGAANAYLDSLAQHRRNLGLPAVSINWGPWADEGMATRVEAGRWEEIGTRLIRPQLALRAFDRLANTQAAQVCVQQMNLARWADLAQSGRLPPILHKLLEALFPLADTEAAAAGDSRRHGAKQGAGELIRQLAALGPAERRLALQTHLREQVGAVLGLSADKVDPEAGFFDLGMNSLMAMEVTNYLRRFLGNNALSAQLVYERPTVDKLAAALSESLNLDESSTGATESRAAGMEAGDHLEWPASAGQTRLWFLEQMARTSPQFNLPIAVRFEKETRLELLERALCELMLRHDALRTTLEIRNGDLRQIVHKWIIPVLRVVNLDEHPHAEARLQKIQEEEARTLFDLVHGPLIRFTLVNLHAGKQVLLITVHHTISDGVSLRVLLDEFLTLHEAFAKDEKSPLPTPESQFGAYAVYERRHLGSRTVQDEVKYWREELRGIPPLELPSDRPRPAVQTHAGDSVPVLLPAEIRERVHNCSRLTGVTPFVTLVAAWSLLLSRYSSQNDFGIGTPVAGRDGPEWSHVVGLFLNMLTLRVQLNQDWSTRELLAQVGAVVRRNLAHQALPFDWLVGQLNPPRDPSRTPLFQAAFILQIPNHDFQARVDAVGISIEDMQPARNAAQFDITLCLGETSTGFRGFLEYNSDLFDRWRIEQMARHYDVLLSALTSRLDTPISRLPMMTADEEQRLLTAWNQSVRSYPIGRCVHERVAEQARRNPRRSAVVCGEKSLTYRELNRRANQLAHYLRGRGVGANTLVGLCLDRSVDMLVGMLAVMKAGGAYVPSDPEFPKHRLEQMLEDAKVAVLVSQTALRDRLPKLDAETVWLDRDRDGIAMESDRDPKHAVGVQDSAYVIYTSGSTGRPKGVVITHRSLLNLLMSMAEETAFTSREVMVAVTTMSFDISGLELLLPLLQGARTVIATLEETRDVQLLRRVLRNNEATIMQATPATWRMLLASGWTNPERIRVLCGGEALHQDLAKGLLDVTESLWNVYGPTETTIWSAIHRVREAERPTVSLGKPLANTQLYILDDHLQPVPLGVPGELFIGGDGVAKGYLNRPELTAERFIPDPFGERPGARLYRTGDLCERLPDGTIEFLGRRDHQVKVRGYRIEIGDIEAAMAARPGIRQAAVTTWKGPDGFDFLAGYLVADEEQRPTLDALKASLRETLPAYMIPGMLMFLDELPLTPNKKVDRRALPSPELVREQAQNEFVAPRTEAETALAEVWKEVLGVERVGIRDNFFDLGGHSLLIVQIMSRLKQRYDVELSIVDLYQHATVESLADYLEQRTGATVQSAASDATPRAAREPSMRDETRHHRTKDGIEYIARRYRESDKAGAIASFAKAFGPGPASVLNAVFNWKYLEHPLASADDAPVIVLQCDGRIVGMDGGVRARFKIKDETLPGSWATDTHIAPDHRSVTGWALARGVRHSSGVMLAMPNANSYPVVSATRAVIDVDRFTDLKACLDLGPVMKTRGFNPLLSLICGTLFSPIPRAFDLYSSYGAGTDIAVTQTPQFDSRIDELWGAASRDYPGIMVRDQAFLSWRFDRCPNRDYTRYIAEKNGAIVGYMVTRETRSQGARRGRIVDFLVARNDWLVFDSLVRAVMQDFRSRGAVSVTCSVSSTQTEHIRRLRRHGFLYTKPGARIVAYREPYEEKLAAIKNWFFTFADGDVDYNDDEGET